MLRRAGDTWGLGIVLAAAASLRHRSGRLHQARVQASEALSLCQELEDPRGIAWGLEVFAGLLAAAGLAEGAARIVGRRRGAAGKRRRLARCRRSDGSGIAISSARERPPVKRHSRLPEPRGARCRPHRRLRSRVSGQVDPTKVDFATICAHLTF